VARRATKLDELKQLDDSGKNYLFLAGPWEFLNWANEAQTSPDLASSFSTAYSSMPYDAIYLMPEEKAWFEAQGQPLPSASQVIGDKPLTSTFAADDVQVAAIAFPLLPEDEQARDEVFADVAELAEGMSKDVGLVVGISHWGMEKEQLFLDKHPQVFDILLGCGQGQSMKGLMASERTFWVRSYRQGKSLTDVRVLKMPSENAQPGFSAKDFYKGELIVLDDAVPNKPAVYDLFPAGGDE